MTHLKHAFSLRMTTALLLASLWTSGAFAAKGEHSAVVDDLNSPKESICRLIAQIRVSNSAAQTQWKNYAICSATLIDGDTDNGAVQQSKSSRYFLTAGHCATSELEMPPEAVEKRSLIECPGGYNALVQDMAVHPNYLASKFLSKFDFSLGSLQSALPIAPARLVSKTGMDYVSGRYPQCGFAGYGEGNDGVLGKLNIIAINPRTMFLSKDRLTFNVILVDNIGSIVQGDSGGPVFCRKSENSSISIFAVHSLRLMDSIGISNAVGNVIPWIRANLAKWERARAGLLEQEDAVENHMANQERLLQCITGAVSRYKGEWSLVARQALHECEYVLKRAENIGFAQVDFLQTIMDGVTAADYMTTSGRTNVDVEPPLSAEWMALALELSLTLKRSGF